jgi:DNA polymerase III subunit epsilon
MDDPADLELLAARLEQSGHYRILRRVPVVTRYADDDPVTLKRLGLIVDIETTGLDPATDRIIELACLPFHFSSEGVLYNVLPGYAGFENPGQPLHEEVVRLTGITDEQLRGQKLDDDAVTTLAILPT